MCFTSPTEHTFTLTCYYFVLFCLFRSFILLLILLLRVLPTAWLWANPRVAAAAAAAALLVYSKRINIKHVACLHLASLGSWGGRNSLKSVGRQTDVQGERRGSAVSRRQFTSDERTVQWKVNRKLLWGLKSRLLMLETDAMHLFTQWKFWENR